MKSNLQLGLFIFAVLSAVIFAHPAYGGGRVYHGYYGGHGYHYYGHPHYYHGYYPYYYRPYPYYYGPGRYTTFGFGFGGVYALGPVYVPPPPTVVYEAPPVEEVHPPVMESPSAEVEQTETAEPPADGGQGSTNATEHSGFEETRRNFHEHGSNRGRLDWVEGWINGRPVRIYYDDFGRVKKQKWLD